MARAGIFGGMDRDGDATAGLPAVVRDGRACKARGRAGLPAVARGSEVSERVGGSNSVVESQPSKLLVAGSIPVSRSSLRSPLVSPPASFGWQANYLSAEARSAKADGWQASSSQTRVNYRSQTRPHQARPAVAVDTGRGAADLSAEAPKARRPM